MISNLRSRLPKSGWIGKTWNLEGRTFPKQFQLSNTISIILLLFINANLPNPIDHQLRPLHHFSKPVAFQWSYSALPEQE
jgi:hypothetical protein